MIGCPALSPKELKLALVNLKGRYALRDRALATLGARTGLRISELLALKVGQVWDGTHTVARFYVARQNTEGKHVGASIVLHPDAGKAVARWIKVGGLAASPGSYLFPSQKGPGRRLGRKSAWEILHPAFLRAGIMGHGRYPLPTEDVCQLCSQGFGGRFIPHKQGNASLFPADDFEISFF